MSQILPGVEKVCEITDQLNDIILQSGPIDINNKIIWDGYLHRYSNQDWADMLEIIAIITAETFYAKPWHIQNIQEALTAFSEQCDYHPRCMDTKANKKKAWKMIMTIREMVNDIAGVRIENK